MQQIDYRSAVNTARAYLRRRDFLTYGSQLVPERLGSESWALSWAYIRKIDDIIDSPRISKETAWEILKHEAEVVNNALNNEYVYRPSHPLRHLWIYWFAENINNYYDESVRKIIWDLYESAVMDVKRRGRIISMHEMRDLLNKKAVKFFQLYFRVGQLDLGKYTDTIAECLGLALGMLDDLVDFVLDLRSGYINITKDELIELGIDADPNSPDFVEKILNSPFFEKRSYKILALLLKARKIAHHLRDSLIRSLILRLTEIFARPILSGKPLPGQKYVFRFGRFLNAILPKDETLAYEIGHRIMKIALKIPQTSPRVFRAIVKKLFQ